MKKYILIMLAALMLAGCEKADESQSVGATLPEGTLTEMETMTTTEQSIPEILDSVTKAQETEQTEAAVEVGGEPEEAVVSEITLTFYEVELAVGEVKMPIVTMYPDNASDKAEIWTSSNEEIATVDWLGNITAVTSGKCVVTVTSAQNPNVSASVAVTVKGNTDSENNDESSDTIEVTYIDGILIANKTYALPADYAPGVNSEAEAAFEKMAADAYGEGLTIYISSGYRSYDYQSGLYQRYVDRSGRAEADRYSARPGHSEHQTGLAFDLNTITDEFKDTDEGKWVAANCHKYGFIIRYPEGKEDVTGYKYEPWHIRYLGVDIATAVYESGLSLEEYLGITSEYAE